MSKSSRGKRSEPSASCRRHEPDRGSLASTEAEDEPSTSRRKSSQRNLDRTSDSETEDFDSPQTSRTSVPRKKSRLVEYGTSDEEDVVFQVTLPQEDPKFLEDVPLIFLPFPDLPVVPEVDPGRRRALDEERRSSAEAAGASMARFKDKFAKLRGPELLDCYSDGSLLCLGHSTSYGPPVPREQRSQADRHHDAYLALDKDMYRLGLLESGVPSVKVLQIVQPDLYAIYRRYLEECITLGVKPFTLSELTAERKAIAAGTFKGLTLVLERIHAHQLTLRADKLKTEGCSNHAKVIEALPRQSDDPLPNWVKGYWSELAKDSALAARGGALERLGDSSHNAPLTQQLIKAPVVKPVMNKVPHCRQALAIFKSYRPVPLCGKAGCLMNNLVELPDDRLILRDVKDRHLCYELQRALCDLQMGAGPWDNHRKDRRRDFVVLEKDSDWSTVRKLLMKNGFFCSVKGHAICATAFLNWTDSALKRFGFPCGSSRRKGCFTNFLVFAPVGIMLIVRTLYGGQGTKARGAAIPDEIVKMLEDPKIRKVQFSIHDEKRYEHMGIEITNRVDATLLTMLLFPQPGVPAAEMQGGLTFAAAKLDSPTVPFVEYRSKQLKERPNIDDLLVLNPEDDDSSGPFNEWNWRVQLYAWTLGTLPVVASFAFGTRFMELHNYDMRADCLRFVHYGMDLVRNKPGICHIPSTDVDRRPFGCNEVYYKNLTADGLPLKPSWFYILPSPSCSLNEATVVRKFMLRGIPYSLDLFGLKKNYIRDFLSYVGAPLKGLSYKDLVKNLLRPGQYNPHVCSRCGSPEHPSDSGECSSWLLRCIYCNSSDHLVEVCDQMLKRCDLCLDLGHEKEHHKTENWLALREKFSIFSLLHHKLFYIHDMMGLDLLEDAEGHVVLDLVRDENGLDFADRPVPFTVASGSIVEGQL